MKKIIYVSTVLATLSLTLFTGCKKDKEVFPTKPQSNGSSSDFAYITPYFPTVSDADVIFVSAQVHNGKTVVVSPFMNTYEYGIVKAGMSKGNFTSLVSIGGVKLNDSTLYQANNLSYLSNTSTQVLGLSNKAAWQISGANTFTYTLNGVCPAYGYNFTSWDNKWIPIYPRTLYTVPHRPSNPLTAQDSATYPNLSYTAALAVYKGDSTTYITDYNYNLTPQYTIPISNFVTNADTVIVTMFDASGFSYIRKIAADSAGIDFRPNTFKGYPSYDISTFNLQINTIRYQDTTVNSKNYYFLKMGSYIKYYGSTK